MRRRHLPFLEEGEIDEPLINLTPLIDVVFVVLITFMLIAPILDVDLVALAPGGPLSEKISSHQPLAISIHSDNTIWFQGKKVDLATLGEVLKREKEKHPQQIPSLIPDKSAHFGTYQAVKNTLEDCGFEQMDVVLQPP